MNNQIAAALYAYSPICEHFCGIEKCAQKPNPKISKNFRLKSFGFIVQKLWYIVEVWLLYNYLLVWVASLATVIHVDKLINGIPLTGFIPEMGKILMALISHSPWVGVLSSPGWGYCHPWVGLFLSPLGGGL